MGCIALYEAIHIAQGLTQWPMPVGFCTQFHRSMSRSRFGQCECTIRLTLRQFWTHNNSLSLLFRSRSVQPDTWEQIQANFSRQQYLTSLQPQFQPRQQQQQQQQQTFQHNQRQLQSQQWSNQYGQQSFQRQPSVATSNAQTVFTGK